MASPTTPFALGAYLGNPNGSSAAAEASFEADAASFTATLGAPPAFLDNYVDTTKPISDWAGNASWQAWSDAQSPVAKGMTPVVALPLASIASGSPDVDTQYRQIASGQHDSTLQGIIRAYADNGYKNLVIRPGWEMNIHGPTYAGDTAQDQADWVAAYQHTYTVLHQQAAAQGVTLSVVWNPSTTNYAAADALGALYPGAGYVDAIGADVYADIYPYSDGNNSSGQPTYHDWNTGQEDTSVAQFIADPVNRTHYWTYPAATRWSNDSSGGHALSLAQLIDFAQKQGKPLAIPETGAGNAAAGTDVADDAAFPQWLAGQLHAAQAQGVAVGFVNLWDSNGGGSYKFSAAADGKPQEAAAWGKYFGASAPTPSATTPSAPATGSSSTRAPAGGSSGTAPITLGAGRDAVVLTLAEDAYQGDAQYTVAVDGTQLGGVQAAAASRAAGQSQQVTLKGDWGGGTHTVSVNFLNDNGGYGSTDRNMFVTGASYNGSTNANHALNLYGGGTQSLVVGQAAPGPVVVGSGPDTIALGIAEDYYLGHAQFTVAVDGTQVGGVQTAAAAYGTGQSQTFNVKGSFGPGQHSVSVSFLNDAYAGTSSTDRNLYVTSASFNGAASAKGALVLYAAGTQSLAVASSTSYSPGAAGGTVTTRGNDTVRVGSGAVTVNAGGPSVNVIGGSGSLRFIGGSGADSITGGSGAVSASGGQGSLTFTAGSGPATIAGGIGKELYEIVNGRAGGTLLIKNFTPGTDSIHLSGYAGTGVRSETSVNGSTQIVLTDNTRISLVGVSAASRGIFS